MFLNPEQQPETPVQPETSQSVPEAEPQSQEEVDNSNRHFKGQQKNEVVHCFTRRHWIVLLRHFISSIFFIGALVLFFAFATPSDLEDTFAQGTYRVFVLLFLMVSTYFLHAFFLRFFNYYLQTLIITNFRIVQLRHTLYFNREGDSIDLSEIQDIAIKQSGVAKTILNYGELIITLSSSRTKTIKTVPNPEYYFSKINKTKREYITSLQENREKNV